MDATSERLWGGGRLLAGPMVRASSLPFRLACLDYGADTVYSEELLAARCINSRRVENPCLGCVDFIRTHRDRGVQDVVFRTQQGARGDAHRCVLQLGAGDAASALKAARLFEADVAAVDVNMGCPKHYAVSAGMGSQLMNTPEVDMI
jgi:tRNA-dihydrouridine synthase 2